MNTFEETHDWQGVHERFATRAFAEGLVDVAVVRHETPVGFDVEHADRLRRA